jgi:RES domain-containing protein
MPEFVSWKSYMRFAASVARKWRYARTADQQAFLDAVLDSAPKRQEVVPSGAEIWRAQIGHVWRPIELYGSEETEEIPAPHPFERMKPPPFEAMEGRANPKGIPCLYTASHRDTAIAEVRPWVGAHVSLATLRTKQSLRILNCSSANSGFAFYLDEPASAERAEANWQLIAQAFSQPVTRNDLLADYAPTQILAETFRQAGFDGIAYHSALGPGHNLAIFDLNGADVVRCQLFRIKSVSIDSEETG